MKQGLRFAWSYGVVLLLLILSWLVAANSLQSVRTSFQDIVVGEDILATQVDTISKLMVDQESALRGYVLTGNPRFLQPYSAGRRDLPRAFADADSNIDDPVETHTLNLVTRAAHQWQRWAESELREYQLGQRATVRSTPEQLTGKRAFDAFRAAIGRLQSKLVQDRQQQLAASRHLYTVAFAILTGMVAAALAIVVVLAWRGIRLFLGERRAQTSLRTTADRYRSLVDTSPDGILLTDSQGIIRLGNSRAAELLGYVSPNALAGTHILDLIAPDDLERAKQALQQRGSGAVPTGVNTQYRLTRQDASSFPSEISSSVLRDENGVPEAITIVIRDITQRKVAEETLLHQALHDRLTGLPNRTLLQDRLHQALVQRDSPTLALLLMDLDRFKEVNDTFGHHYGDLLLQQLGLRLQQLLRESDTVARLGGDEIAVLLPGADAESAQRVATKLLDALGHPFLVEGQSLDIGASVGVALAPLHGSDATTLMQRADVAMYVAKRSGGGFAFYSPDDDQYSPERLNLIGELRRAIEQDELVLHYQPKVNVKTGEIDGVEALVRWQHPERGVIPPDHFIPLAEHTGLIQPLSQWVLEHALEQCHRWQVLGMPVRVSVNLSARNLRDPELITTIATLLERWNLQPQYLDLELTESAVMDDPFRSIDILTRLHELGIRLSIDDFGTGYSSLAYLKRLPVDEIKIDKSFVLDMDSDENDCSIVRATISLGHDLGLIAVAEGVENQSIWDQLRILGCDLVQGYHLSRPMPAAECTSWLRARPAAAAS